MGGHALTNIKEGESDYDWDTGTYRSGSLEAALINQGLDPNGTPIKTLRERFRKGGLDPDGAPDFSPQGLARLHESVEGLKNAYNRAGKPTVEAADIDDEGLTTTDKGIKVQVNPNFVTSNYIFAAILFHEYRHAWQYSSGSWNSRTGDSVWTHLVLTANPTLANHFKERDAYAFQIAMGAGDVGDAYHRYKELYEQTKNFTELYSLKRKR